MEGGGTAADAASAVRAVCTRHQNSGSGNATRVTDIGLLQRLVVGLSTRFSFCNPDMPLASGRETGSQLQSAPYQGPLSNTRPSHHQNSVGTCGVQRVAQ